MGDLNSRGWFEEEEIRSLIRTEPDVIDLFG